MRRDDWLDNQLTELDEAARREMRQMYWVLALLAAFLVVFLVLG